MTPAIAYEPVEEIIASTAQERALVAHLREAKELLEDVNKEFTRLDGEARKPEQDPDYALWRRIGEWLGE